MCDFPKTTCCLLFLCLLGLLFLLLTRCSFNVASSPGKVYLCLFLLLENVSFQLSSKIAFFSLSLQDFSDLFRRNKPSSLTVANAFYTYVITYVTVDCMLMLIFNLVPFFLLLLEPPIQKRHVSKCLVQGWTVSAVLNKCMG